MDASEVEKLSNILAKVGLPHLLPSFLEEKVKMELIPSLQEADFERLGVRHVGERVMLLNLAKGSAREKQVGAEIKKLFLQKNSSESTSSSGDVCSGHQSATQSGNLIARAGDVCRKLRNRRSYSKKTKRCSNKEMQKGLVVINFQDKSVSDGVLREKEILYDGLMRYMTDMSEGDIREEIVRLVRQKHIPSHDLQLIQSKDFDFVRCVNKHTKCIDGDVPFDACGITQVYKNGSIYVRLNTSILQLHDSDESSDDCLPVVKIKKSVTDTGAHFSSSSDTNQSVMAEFGGSHEVIQISDNEEGPHFFPKIASDDKPALDSQVKVDNTESTPRSLGEIVTQLATLINSGDTFDMVVRRGYVLSDAIKRLDRSSFDPSKKIIVYFLGENGSDGGGLTREFFSLMARHFTKYIEQTGCFKHNSLALHDGVYFKLGQLMAMALVHGGSAVRLFSRSVFQYLKGMKPCNIVVDIDEVPEEEVRAVLNKIMSAGTTDNLREIVEEYSELLMDSGVMKPSRSVALDDKIAIVQSVALQKVILNTLGELAQFKEGLHCLGVGHEIAQHGELLQQFYIKGEGKLTSDIVRKVFREIKFSEQGSNARTREENSYMYFLEYLDICEKVSEVMDLSEILQSDDAETIDSAASLSQTSNVTLEVVMNFFSGATDVPPAGYEVDPTINFNDNNVYPTSSTCALQLTLPTLYLNFESFKSALDTAFLMHGGFGLS